MNETSDVSCSFVIMPNNYPASCNNVEKACKDLGTSRFFAKIRRLKKFKNLHYINFLQELIEFGFKT